MGSLKKYVTLKGRGGRGVDKVSHTLYCFHKLRFLCVGKQAVEFQSLFVCLCVHSCVSVTMLVYKCVCACYAVRFLRVREVKKKNQLWTFSTLYAVYCMKISEKEEGTKSEREVKKKNRLWTFSTLYAVYCMKISEKEEGSKSEREVKKNICVVYIV